MTLATMTRYRCCLAAGGTALALGTPGAALAVNHVVPIAHMSYGRLPAVKVGDTVTWINRDTVPHTVTARDKSFDLRLAPGQKGTITASKPGSFPFYCIYHAAMRGVLKVTAK